MVVKRLVEVELVDRKLVAKRLVEVAFVVEALVAKRLVVVALTTVRSTAFKGEPDIVTAPVTTQHWLNGLDCAVHDVVTSFAVRIHTPLLMVPASCCVDGLL